MKRYWLFGGEVYYAGGGMYDFISGFDTKEEAVLEASRRVASSDIQWWHVFDTQIQEYVAKHSSAHC